uniref:Capsid protein alpha n=1 Tax=Sheep associated noda-like virus TaxID=2796362 RepID=A0A8E0NA06_9VIRU|nr:TPA: coat protein precursor alpha [Sheep associated noda-like virus]
MNNNLRKYTTPVNPPVKPKKKKQKKKGKQKKLRPIRLYTRSKPAAHVRTNRAYMTTTRNGNNVRVSGYDLIYNTDEGIVEGPFCTVTCNPAYWTGTRVAAIANAYAQYRPLHICFDYFPQVSTMTNGNIITGTIWNNNTGGNNLQQSLATSNGGKIFPVYSTCRIPIKLATNLNQNLFNFQGYIDSETNPFVFLATTQQSNNLVPGYFMVSYVFEFKNPLGEGFDYDTDVKLAGDITSDDVWETTSAMLLSSTNAAAIGTKLVVQVIDGAIQFFLGGSRIGMLADCILKLFKSKPKMISKLQDDIINLNQSNTIVRIHARLEDGQQGSSVIVPFEINSQLKLKHLVKFNEINGNVNYLTSGGLFVKPTKVGTGRYNLAFMNMSNTDDRISDDWYVLKSDNPVPDYSVHITTSAGQFVGTDPARLWLKYKDGTPIECEIPVMDHFDEVAPFILADIALEDIAEATGVNQQVVGQGSVILVPTKNNTKIKPIY